MIDRLKRRLILICTASLLTVVTLVFSVILVLNLSSMNRNMDILADRVSEGRGKFPDSFLETPPFDRLPPKDEKNFEFITPETPFSTRHFTVFFTESGEVKEAFTDSIYSISDALAIEYAKEVDVKGNSRGWKSNYRYKVFSYDGGHGIVFVDGSMNLSAFMESTIISGVVLLGCAALVLILIILFSKKVVKPIAESYEKQKQFITDANHELKTPLTLILANLDIAKNEIGENEWLEDARAEGHRMTELVNQLVALSRMDEAGHSLNLTDIDLSYLIKDSICEFEPIVKERQKSLSVSLENNITYYGDEALIYRLVGILIDNAIKYCDLGGEIKVELRRARKTVLTVENTYAAVGETELNRLFDRFYRADKARKFTGGYGIGLSMAKAIVEKHGGDISAYKKDEGHIGFKIVF